MTTYNYLSEMQDFCFRAVMALKVINDERLKRFYLKSESGFVRKLEGLSVKEAQKHITQSQIEQYITIKNFVEQKEQEAAKAVLHNQPTAAEKMDDFLNDVFELDPQEKAAEEEYNEVMNDNQQYDDKMQAKLEAMHD